MGTGHHSLWMNLWKLWIVQELLSRRGTPRRGGIRCVGMPCMPAWTA